MFWQLPVSPDAGQSRRSPKPPGTAWPTTDWPNSTPEAEGIDPVAVESLVEDIEAGDRWIRLILDRGTREEPGTVFDSNSGVSVLLGKIVGVGTGRRVDRWAEERLFEPIGIDEYYWKKTPDGDVDTEGGFTARRTTWRGSTASFCVVASGTVPRSCRRVGTPADIWPTLHAWLAKSRTRVSLRGRRR